MSAELTRDELEDYYAQKINEYLNTIRDLSAEVLFKERELLSLREALCDPQTAYANLLRGVIFITKTQALHYCGITAVDGWRDLIGWDEETETINPKLRKPVKKKKTTGAPVQAGTVKEVTDEILWVVHQHSKDLKNIMDMVRANRNVGWNTQAMTEAIKTAQAIESQKMQRDREQGEKAYKVFVSIETKLVEFKNMVLLHVFKIKD